MIFSVPQGGNSAIRSVRSQFDGVASVTCALVGVDRMLKCGHVVPFHSKTSRVVAAALESHILATVPRTPETVLLDKGLSSEEGHFRTC